MGERQFRDNDLMRSSTEHNKTAAEIHKTHILCCSLHSFSSVKLLSKTVLQGYRNCQLQEWTLARIICFLRRTCLRNTQYSKMFICKSTKGRNHPNTNSHVSLLKKFQSAPQVQNIDDSRVAAVLWQHLECPGARRQPKFTFWKTEQKVYICWTCKSLERTPL